MSRLNDYSQLDQWHIPQTMTAVTLSGVGFEHLAVQQVPVPVPGPNQLLARVDAAGICTSNIKLLAQGPDHAFINGWDLNQWPIILGDEGAVTLVQVGEHLQDQYQVGQRFGIQPAVDVAPINHRDRYRDNAKGMHKCAVGYTLGGNLAQYILIGEEILEGGCLLPLPSDDLPYFAVSMAEPISCVYSAQQRQFHIDKADAFAERVPKLGMLEGGVTLVIGAGAMGRMHVEMAMRFRPRAIILSDLQEERLALTVKLMGAKAEALGIDLITVVPDGLESVLDEVSNGRGADDIVMAVGIQQVQQHALSLLAPEGVANLFGGLPRGRHVLELDAIRVHYDEIKVVGSSGGQPSDMIATIQAIADGDIDPGNYVYGICGLQHVPEILQMIKDAKVDGKAIVYPHAPIDHVQTVTHWCADDEKAFLESHLLDGSN